MRSYDLLIGNTTAKTNAKVSIRSPYDRKVVGKVAFAGPDEIQSVIQSACDSFTIISQMPAYQRATILRKMSDSIAEHRDELAETIRDEAGKPIRLALAEVERAVATFSFASAEALRFEGSLLPMDVAQAGVGRVGLTRRFPVGPILAITPFNFPLNLVAHKVAPAIAAGNSIIVKPSSQTPMSSLMLAQIASDAGLPAGVLNVIPCQSQAAKTMVSDHRLKMLTFTGSAIVGWMLKSQADRKKVTLELGGNAATIVEPDSNIDVAARKLAAGAFSYAGQICISVQRVFVQESIFDMFMKSFLQYVKDEIICGDPADPNVLCGPMIDCANANRIEEWIAEARQHGAEVFSQGERQGNVIQPTVLTGVASSLRIARQEAFGPVVVVDTYSTFEEAIQKVNDSPYGLQAGVFTQDVEKVMKAFREIDVGGIIHNDTSVFRADPMPYGGVKDSGFGREGLKYAIEEMTEPRLLVLREQ